MVSSLSRVRIASSVSSVRFSRSVTNSVLSAGTSDKLAIREPSVIQYITEIALNTCRRTDVRQRMRVNSPTCTRLASVELTFVDPPQPCWGHTRLAEDSPELLSGHHRLSHSFETSLMVSVFASLLRSRTLISPDDERSSMITRVRVC